MRQSLASRFLVLFLALAVPAAPNPADIEWSKSSFDDILKKAREEDKHVFIDFYAVWCGPCKMLEKTTYKDEKVVEFLSSIIAVKYDAEKDEGKVLAKRFKVKSYPSLILLDPKGEEIDRHLGYLNAKEFLKTMKDYMRGIGTISYYEDKLKQNKNDVETLFILGKKHASSMHPEQADELLEKVIKLDPENKKGYTDQALLYLGRIHLLNQDYKTSASHLQELIEKYPQSEMRNSAHKLLAAAYEKMGDKEKCLETYRSFIADNPEDPKALNSFAWFCAVKNIAIDEAIPVAEKAIKLSDEDPGIMDTLAELYYAKGEYLKAVEIEEKASRKDPEDIYLKDQIIKYLKAALESSNQANN